MEYMRSHGNVARYHHHFLFEATGDSEDDSFLVEYSEANLQNFIWMNILGGFPFMTSSTEDDAESRSCDSIDENRDFLDSNDTSVEEEEEVEEVMEVEVEEEEEEEDEDEVSLPVAKDSRNTNNTNDGVHHGSRKMMKNEMEADRFFWEACLKQGIPELH